MSFCVAHQEEVAMHTRGRFWRMAAGVGVLASPLRHSAALPAGLRCEHAVLGEAARLGRHVAAALAAGLRGQRTVLGEAALLARHVGATLAGKLTLFGGLHAGEAA